MIKLGNNLIKYGLTTGLVIASIGFLFYNFIGEIFIKETLVLEKFDNVFWIVLIMQPLCAVTFIYDGMFKGMGETAYLRNVLVLSTTLIFIPSLLIFDLFDLQLYGIWYTFVLWIVARGSSVNYQIPTKVFTPSGKELILNNHFPL